MTDQEMKKELKKFTYKNLIKIFAPNGKITINTTQQIEEYCTSRIQALRKLRKANRKIKNELYNKLLEIYSIY